MFFKIKNLYKSYDKNMILKDISFNVRQGELISLVGPSGTGKTTLLKIIAGLEKQDSGSIIFKNPGIKKHPVILVFQDYVLFPALNVFKNVAFGLEARRIDKKEIKKQVHEILNEFQLLDKLNHYPSQLSAGQKQRVAIARALVINPSVLLLDEPFANLDKNLKYETAEFIRNTQKKFDITTIVVTHDLEEAFMISDKLGVMLKGQILQYDTVENIYHKPVSIEAAQFLGHVNIIPESYFDILNIDSSGLTNGECYFSRAESFDIEKSLNGKGIIDSIIFSGHYILYNVKIDDLLLKVYRIQDDLKIGDRVNIKLNKLIKLKECFDEKSE